MYRPIVTLSRVSEPLPSFLPFPSLLFSSFPPSQTFLIRPFPLPPTKTIVSAGKVTRGGGERCSSLEALFREKRREGMKVCRRRRSQMETEEEEAITGKVPCVSLSLPAPNNPSSKGGKEEKKGRDGGQRTNERFITLLLLLPVSSLCIPSRRRRRCWENRAFFGEKSEDEADDTHWRCLPKKYNGRRGAPTSSASFAPRRLWIPDRQSRN